MKILVINKQNPSQSRYMNHKNIGLFLCGRRVPNYIILLIKGNDTEVIGFDSCECTEIQSKINSLFE